MNKHKIRYALRELTQYLKRMLSPVLLVFLWLFFYKNNYQGLIRAGIIYYGMLISYYLVR